MIFSLDVRRARKGDCLLLHYGAPDDPGLMLIDGGPSQVYQPHLKPRLADIKASRGLGASDPLPVDLLMISHIDDDHINGILELTGELVDAKVQKQPPLLKIRSFWHNTFDDVVGKDPEELLSAVTAQFGAASLSGEPDVEGLNPDAAKVLASVDQGMRLRDDARNLKLPLNRGFDGKLVMGVKGAKPIKMGKGLTFTVAGPMKKELVALQKAHDAFLETPKGKKKTKAALAAFTDKSVPNLSSIVVVAEVGKKRMLLTGDARGDKILQGLELVGLVKPNGTMHVEVLKMPHHGSSRNMEQVFLERVTADHYVMSGNGEHGNPERETLEMLLGARGDAEYTVHLTYPVEEIDVDRKKDWEKEQQKEKTRKKKNPNVKVRANWSPKKHSLKSLFAEHPDFAKKVRVVEEDQPHLIDALDPVDF